MKMKKSKVIGVALALALTTLPCVSSYVPFSSTSDIAVVSAASSAGYYKVTTKDPSPLGDLNFRATAGGKKIGTIPKDAYVYSNGVESGSWLKVKYNGQWGWASKNYLVYKFGFICEM